MEKGYNVNNLKFVSYNSDVVKKMAEYAHDLGILVHIEGIPFGKSSAKAIGKVDMDSSSYKPENDHERLLRDMEAGAKLYVDNDSCHTTFMYMGDEVLGNHYNFGQHKLIDILSKELGYEVGST